MGTKLQNIEKRMRRLEILYRILAAQRRAEIVKQRLARRREAANGK